MCVSIEVPYPDLRLFVLDAVEEELAAASKPSQFLADGVHTNGVKWQERAGLKALGEGGGVGSMTMPPPTSAHSSSPTPCPSPHTPSKDIMEAHCYVVTTAE